MTYNVFEEGINALNYGANIQNDAWERIQAYNVAVVSLAKVYKVSIIWGLNSIGDNEKLEELTRKYAYSSAVRHAESGSEEQLYAQAGMDKLAPVAPTPETPNKKTRKHKPVEVGLK